MSTHSVFQNLSHKMLSWRQSITKGTHGESLTGTDLVRFLALVEMYILWLEDVDSQFRADLHYQDGQLEDIVDKLSAEFTAMSSTPEVRQWWHDDAKQTYLTSFVEKIDQHVDAVE